MESKNNPTSFPRFFVVEPKDNNPLEKVSPFAIAKSIQCNVGTVKSVKKIRLAADRGEHTGIRWPRIET